MAVARIYTGVNATITGASGNGSVITFNAINTFLSSNDIDVKGINPNSYNATYENILFANSTVFEASGAVTDAFVTGGTGRSWITPSGFNRPRVWDGLAWVPAELKAWNGISWQQAQETQTVTVGSYIFKSLSNFGWGGFYGSISDGTFGFIDDAPIIQLSWGNSGFGIAFTLSGNRANSGWTKMTINGTDYTRATATYQYNSEADTTTWFMGGPNPFGETEGVQVPVVITQ